MTQSPTRGNDLDVLLQAIEYVENQEKRNYAREREHGYAVPATQHNSEPLTTKIRPIKRNQNRTSHNELEKNRRAHLRRCLENLKAIVPLRQDATRHTTLGLLNQACDQIKTLEREGHSLNDEKLQLCKRNAILKRTLLQLEISRHRRNSTGSGWSSGHSESSNDSDKDDEIIDVMGCGDDHEILKAAIRLRSPNLITISVPKAISVPSKSTGSQVGNRIYKAVSL